MTIAALALAGPALAQSSHEVRGYTRENGTYVEPHYQSNPNATKLDNYSTQGNVNPYTGQPGTVNPYAVRPAPSPYATPSNPYELPPE